MGRFRAIRVLTGFMALTLPLMPVQAAFLRLSPRLARRFPHWYHRQVCRVMGLRLSIEGAIATDAPVLIVANHTSWLDIPVMSAVAPVSFVAKKEVGRWPFVSTLARLQRTVFVDRERRTAVGDTASEILTRLAAGDTVVLFAEGTSSDGRRVLPFKTSLFAAAKPTRAVAAGAASAALVQCVSVVYTRRHGLPIDRVDRPLVAWYGDMEMQSHAWQLLQAGPIDVEIRISPPIPLADYADRKDLARRSEEAVRAGVVAVLRGLPAGVTVATLAPAPVEQRRKVGAASEPASPRRGWT